MTNKLVIVESPAKARTIGKFLGRGYKVEASNGHIRDLPKSQMGVDIDNNFEPRYITIRGRGEILDRIRKDARSASKYTSRQTLTARARPFRGILAAHVLGIDRGIRGVPRGVSRDHQQGGHQGRDEKAARPIDLELAGRAAGAPRAGPAGGLQDQPAALWSEGEKRDCPPGRVQSVATRMIVRPGARRSTRSCPQEYWALSGKFHRRQAWSSAQNCCRLNGDEPQPTSPPLRQAEARRWT